MSSQVSRCVQQWWPVLIGADHFLSGFCICFSNIFQKDSPCGDQKLLKNISLGTKKFVFFWKDFARIKREGGRERCSQCVEKSSTKC